MIALDTNILVYAEDVSLSPAEAERVLAARALAARVPPASLCLPVQVLGELFNVLVRKARMSRPAARGIVQGWSAGAAMLAPTTETVLAEALDLAAEHRLQIWDAVILAAAAEARCDFLLSEDLHPGFAYRGCTVANPFASHLPPRLARALSPAGPGAIQPLNSHPPFRGVAFAGRLFCFWIPTPPRRTRSTKASRAVSPVPSSRRSRISATNSSAC